ncbi:DUF421 domain-containing protein [Thalassobacillus hwangdonensis]|uniref:DUF421 domain-containing protein n=1 Tax=Thalassobacillus hwangdonensis TaxID=546108 RepID=A0ABW3KW00_9BACI
MEILKDGLLVIGRIFTILPLLLFVTLYMGKRSIGELPVFDFLVVLVLGSVVGADIADPNIAHIHTVIAIIVIAVLHKLIIYVKLKNNKIGKLITFEPIIVIYQGSFISENMKKVNYSVENVLQMLREKDVFHVNDVEIALVEAGGNLSVKLVPAKENIKREDMNIIKKSNAYEIPFILDGEIQKPLLEWLNKDKRWIDSQLKAHGIASPSDVFYGAVDAEGNVHLNVNQESDQNLPPIEH